MTFEVGGCGKSKLMKSGQNTVPSSSNPNQQKQFPESSGAWTQVGRFWVEAESCKLWTMEAVWCKSPDALLGTVASLVWEIRGRSPSCPRLLKWGKSPRKKRAREEVVLCSLRKLLPGLRLTSELCVQRANSELLADKAKTPEWYLSCCHRSRASLQPESNQGNYQLKLKPQHSCEKFSKIQSCHNTGHNIIYRI